MVVALVANLLQVGAELKHLGMLRVVVAEILLELVTSPRKTLPEPTSRKRFLLK